MHILPYPAPTAGARHGHHSPPVRRYCRGAFWHCFYYFLARARYRHFHFHAASITASAAPARRAPPSSPCFISRHGRLLVSPPPRSCLFAMRFFQPPHNENFLISRFLRRRSNGLAIFLMITLDGAPARRCTRAARALPERRRRLALSYIRMPRFATRHAQPRIRHEATGKQDILSAMAEARRRGCARRPAFPLPPATPQFLFAGGTARRFARRRASDASFLAGQQQRGAPRASSCRQVLISQSPAAAHNTAQYFCRARNISSSLSLDIMIDDAGAISAADLQLEPDFSRRAPRQRDALQRRAHASGRL